ncbi:MAG: hypothetical protein RR578_00365 [Bacilli bacterium]
MFCYNCAKEIKEKNGEVITVCPQCQTELKKKLEENDEKLLTQAAHGRLHDAGDLFNSGMCGLVLGGIGLTIALLFFVLSYKATNGGQLVLTCTEFYVFCALGSVSLIGLGYGIVAVVLASIRKKTYKQIIKDIQNKTFVQ